MSEIKGERVWKIEMIYTNQQLILNQSIILKTFSILERKQSLKFLLLLPYQQNNSSHSFNKTDTLK